MSRQWQNVPLGVPSVAGAKTHGFVVPVTMRVTGSALNLIFNYFMEKYAEFGAEDLDDQKKYNVRFDAGSCRLSGTAGETKYQ